MRPNKNTMNIRLLVAALASVCIVGSLTGCGGPTKPKDVKYNIYTGVFGYRDSTAQSKFYQVYVYDADSLTLLDSLPRAQIVDDLVASPDGRWLYLRDSPSAYEASTLWKLDARTKQVLWSQPGPYGHLRFLANGRLLLSGNSVIRQEDGTIVRRLSDSLQVWWGPESGTKVAATVLAPPVGFANDSVLRVLDVATGEVSGRYAARLSSGIVLQGIYTARLHPDGRRVLAIGVYGSVYNSWFVVGDVVTGQTLFEYRINYPHGEIAISSDGNTAVFTDPGTTGFGEIGQVHAIDLATLRLIYPAVPIIPAGPLRMIPGTSKVITAVSSDGWSAVFLQIFDLKTMMVEKTLRPPWEPVLTAFTVGLRP